MNKSKELLFSITKKDFKIEYYSGTGAGGQHRNKHQNCVRFKHMESGVITSGTESKSRDVNLKKAFNRMTKNKAFKAWLRTKALEKISIIGNVDLKKEVDEAMKEENLKIEYY